MSDPEAPQEEQRPDFAPEQEVRFAVVMYGGVSLAIYINGVAQELYRLVRSTAPAKREGSEERLYLAESQLEGSERAYRELGSRLGLGTTQKADGGSPPVRTRFVVDIISGTSAGGINGVLLALALARQKNFSVSSELWRNVADIDKLLREKGSEKDLEPPPPREAESLLSGYRLYSEAREAMNDMGELNPGDPWQPAFAEQLDLAVTATDLAGLPLPVRLTDETTILESTHRKVFRFTCGSRETTGEEHSDFERLDLMLGFAARATSSFPFAFEPVLLNDITDVKRPGDDDSALGRFFADHVRMARAPERVAFADGGYLDNKPFSYATEALRSRRADVPVHRVLLYIEPHPTVVHSAEPATDRDRPDVIGNVVASMALPRHETIREDVAAVGERNLVVERLRELGLQAERDLDGNDPLAKLREPPLPTNDREADGKLGPAGPAYSAYRAVRVRTVLDARATLGAKLRGADPGDAVARQTREALRVWIEAEHRDTHGAFLTVQDVAFQRRRLSFLNDRVNDLLRGGSRAVRMIAAADIRDLAGVPGLADAPRLRDPQEILDSPRDPDLERDDVVAALEALKGQAKPLRALKTRLNNAIDGLRRADRAPSTQNLDDVLDDGERTLYGKITKAADRLPGDAGPYMRAVEAFLAVPLADSDAEIEAAIKTAEGVDGWIRELLWVYDTRFEAFDMVVLPLAYPDLGETNAVDLVRISPLDALGIRPEDPPIQDDPVAKLAGIRVGHFGGFLDKSWRDNDLMWGRLDAADVIIETLLKNEGKAERTRLRVQAQAAILREELGREGYSGDLKQKLARQLAAEHGPEADRELVDGFSAAYRELDKLAPKTQDALTARGARITGKVLANAARGRKWPSWPVTGAALLAPPLAKWAPKLKRLLRTASGSRG